MVSSDERRRCRLRDRFSVCDGSEFLAGSGFVFCRRAGNGVCNDLFLHGGIQQADLCADHTVRRHHDARGEPADLGISGSAVGFVLSGAHCGGISGHGRLLPRRICLWCGAGCRNGHCDGCRRCRGMAVRRHLCVCRDDSRILYAQRPRDVCRRLSGGERCGGIAG